MSTFVLAIACSVAALSFGHPALPALPPTIPLCTLLLEETATAAAAAAAAAMAH